MNRETHLRSRFYNVFDSAALTSFVARLSEMSEEARRGHTKFIGEGAHFQSFEFAAGGLALAVNLAKMSFVRRGDLAIARWKDALSLARNLEHVDLIPPMELLALNANTIAIVMPKGEIVSKTRGRHVESLICDTAKALSRAGLVLDDYPQVREVEGVPFIIDWSDLCFVI